MWTHAPSWCRALQPCAACGRVRRFASARAGAATAASSKAQRRWRQRAASEEFEAWLRANPLPTAPSSWSQAPQGQALAARSLQPLAAAAFPASDVVPQLRALLAAQHRKAVWVRETHAWIAADAQGRPEVELRLPRIVPPPRAAPGTADAGLEHHIAQLLTGGSGGGRWRWSGGGGDAPGPGGWVADAEPLIGAQPLLLDAAQPGPQNWGLGGAAWGDTDEQDDGDDDTSALGAEEAAELAELRLAALGAAAGPPAAAPAAAGLAPRLGSVLLVLLSADAAALGLWRGGDLARHKVLTGYTVRRSQGGAQAAYEARGGRGGTAGSALRWRETRRLWQRAAARLAAWRGDIDECHTLFQSGAVRNWGLLYSSTDPPPPVDRRDPRWQRLGAPVPRPRFKALLAAYRGLSFGERRVYGEQSAGCV